MLGVDYGDARIGVATCDELEILATARDTIRSESMRKNIDAIAAIAKAENAERRRNLRPKDALAGAPDATHRQTARMVDPTDDRLEIRLLWRKHSQRSLSSQRIVKGQLKSKISIDFL